MPLGVGILEHFIYVIILYCNLIISPKKVKRNTIENNLHFVNLYLVKAQKKGKIRRSCLFNYKLIL